MMFRLYCSKLAVPSLLLLFALSSCTERKPLVFIYPDSLIPEKFHNYSHFGDQTTEYGLDQLFVNLLRASPHVTSDASKADYFYMDAWFMYRVPEPPHNGVRISNDDFRDLIGLVKGYGPYWDRKGGADHIFALSNDDGRCLYLDVKEVSKAIFLTHWGRIGLSDDGVNKNCNLLDRWGAECDPTMRMAQVALSAEPYGKDGWFPCHIPGQDIVVPATFAEAYVPTPDGRHQHTKKVRTPYLHDDLKGLPRDKLLFYSGKIDWAKDMPEFKDKPWIYAGYSNGARQTVYRLFANNPHMALNAKHTYESYWKQLSTAIFGVAAAGYGHGGRFKVCATRGCIPVLIQDGIRHEFEDQIEIEKYSLRIPTWFTHKLEDVLILFNQSGRVGEMQKALDCAWRFHWWRRGDGKGGEQGMGGGEGEGRAFEIIMCELKRRLLEPNVKRRRLDVDFDKCTIDCGDGVKINLRDMKQIGV